jgi:hypothetical protein
VLLTFGRIQTLQNSFQTFPIPCQKGDICACSCQRLCNGASNPFAAATNEGIFAYKICLHLIILIVFVF